MYIDSSKAYDIETTQGSRFKLLQNISEPTVVFKCNNYKGHSI